MRVLSWNIQWGRGCDRRVDLDRIARVLRDTCDADVMCLQEVAVNFPGLPGGAGEDEVALLAAAFPGYGAHFAPGVDLPDGRGGRALFGNLILSRLPVAQVFRHGLPWPHDPAVPSMPRVCLEVVVDSAFGPLRVLTTHLEYYSAVQRAAQAAALRDIHGAGWLHHVAPRSDKDVDSPFAVRARGAHSIVCGDFNCTPDEPEHAAIGAAFDDGAPRLVDAWRALHGTPHAHTVGLHGCDWPDHPYCCDFFFVSEPLAARLARVEVNQASDASDHQPLWIELREA